MSGIASVTIVGNLGQDPEIRYSSSGACITSISVATSHKKGEAEFTDWHRVVFFGKRGEVVGEHFHKGSKIALVGRLQYDEWEDKNGVKRVTAQIVGDSFTFLDSRGDEPRQDHDQSPDHGNDDDIPF